MADIRFVASTLVVGILLTGTARTEAQPGSALSKSELRSFDEEVRVSREAMRQCCALTQMLMNEKKADQAVQQQALQELRRAEEQWQRVCERSATHPPSEYAGDTKFAVRLADIAELMKEMEAHLRAGNAKKSFQVCGFACGLFVSLHEDNGLIYALDRLFHLRKAAKSALTALQNGALLPADMVTEILHSRDRVFTAPCPSPDDPERCERYRQALANLSHALDRSALFWSNGDRAAAMAALSQALGDINNAYGLALY